MPPKKTHGNNRNTKSISSSKFKSEDLEKLFQTPEWQKSLEKISNLGKGQAEALNKLNSSFRLLPRVLQEFKKMETITMNGISIHLPKWQSDIINIHNAFISSLWTDEFVKKFRNLDSLVNNYDPIKILEEMELSQTEMNSELKDKLLILEQELKININNKCYFSVSIILGAIFDMFLLDLLTIYEQLNPKVIQKILEGLKIKKQNLQNLTLGPMIYLYSQIYKIDERHKDYMRQLKSGRDMSHSAKMPNDLYKDMNESISMKLFMLYSTISDIKKLKEKLRNEI